VSEAKHDGDWYVDLIGILLSSTAISYLSYLGFRDSMTGEVRNFKALVFTIVLIFGSYLLSYLLIFRISDYFKINWIFIAVGGSVLCSITFRLPVKDVYLEGVLIGTFFFSLIALALTGSVRLIYWILNPARHQGQYHLRSR
jgi:hypothetical protein